MSVPILYGSAKLLVAENDAKADSMAQDYTRLAGVDSAEAVYVGQRGSEHFYLLVINGGDVVNVRDRVIGPPLALPSQAAQLAQQLITSRPRREEIP